MGLSNSGAGLLGVLLLGSSLFGCGGSASQGGERQGCYPNGTCNTGLTCLSNVCVNAGFGGAGGGSGASGSGGGGGRAGGGGAGGRTGVGGLDGGVLDARADGDAAVDASHAPTLSGDIQPLFTQACAVSGCHIPGSPPSGLILTAGTTYSQTVGVVSQQKPPMARVTSGDATNSYLYLKIIGQGVAGTLPQPPPSTGIALSQAQKDMVRDWINAGAKNN
jgi:hypothetical protein